MITCHFLIGGVAWHIIFSILLYIYIYFSIFGGINLRYFVYVILNREEQIGSVTEMVMSGTVPGKRPRGRPRKRWSDAY